MPYRNHMALGLPVLISVAIAALLLAGCFSPGTSHDAIPPDRASFPDPPQGSGQQVVDASNQFAFDLYTTMASDPAIGGKNIFFSPISISSALAITYEGARGETADEIAHTFHYPREAGGMRRGYEDLNHDLNQKDTAYSLALANALWAEEAYLLLPEYAAVAERSYGARVTNLDFVKNTDTSRRVINQWIAEQTNGKITDLLPSGAVNTETRLVITNAVYFKGIWEKQFNKEATTVGEFHAGDGTTVQIPMMQRTDANAIFGYTETDTFQVLRMPYESGTRKQLSMLVLLPREENLTPVEASLTIPVLAELRQNLTTKRVLVYFPKFTMETTYSLKEPLITMGMPVAFTPGADFSGMDGTRDLYIGDVIHQAFVEVNEEGTEAAAATAVVMKMQSAPGLPAPEFHADHPFLFIIEDDATGLILFIGRVEYPVTS